MNIVRLNGSVAEQMFQYAFSLALLDAGREVALDVPETWLQTRFRLPYRRVATADELKRYGRGTAFIRLMARLRKPVGNIVTDSGSFDPSLLTLDDTYFDGGWQSPRYFSKINDLVAKTFTIPKQQLSSTSSQLLKTLSSGETVVVHVHEPQSGKCTCTPDYYNWAVANVLSALGRTKFVVFATDVEWANRHLDFQGNKADIIHYPADRDTTLMAYLSKARHNIIANTLTSWWGAWLNSNPDKIVIAPSLWSKTHPTPDLLPPHWTTVPVT